MNEESELLFSYGTLRSEPVQVAIFGRTLKGRPDVLEGYRLKMLRIRQERVAAVDGGTNLRNIEFTGSASDSVDGMVFTVTLPELEKADVYERGAQYERFSVQLKSG